MHQYICYLHIFCLNILKNSRFPAKQLRIYYEFFKYCLLSLAPPPGGSTPPGITAPTVTSIPSPISVNGFTGLPPPQANGQAPAEAMFTNGIHPYPGTTHSHPQIYSRILPDFNSVEPT